MKQDSIFLQVSGDQQKQFACSTRMALNADRTTFAKLYSGCRELDKTFDKVRIATRSSQANPELLP